MDACSMVAAVDARTAAVSIAIDGGISGGGGGGGGGTTERMRSSHCFPRGRGLSLDHARALVCVVQIGLTRRRLAHDARPRADVKLRDQHRTALVSGLAPSNTAGHRSVTGVLGCIGHQP